MAALEVVAFGDRALRFSLPTGKDRRALLAALRGVPGVIDVVLAEDTGAAVLEAETTDETRAAVAHALADASPASRSPAAHHVVRVIYDGEDLAQIAAATGATPEDVIARHLDGEYEVAMLGFLPGFAYLRGLDPRLVLPRRAQPRTRVPAGSVAIAAEYTSIYPFASPGGWNLLGRAVGSMFDASGARLAHGDRVRFERAEPGEASVPATLAPSPPVPGRVHLEIARAQGPAIVVDAGRLGHMHEGVPHGGAMDPGALAYANASASNVPGAAALEVFGSLEIVARGGRVTVADDVRGATTLEDGQSLVVATEGRARMRYLAVRGGIDVPMVLGGRGTLLVARMGGYGGRPVKRGDRLAIADSPPASPAASSRKGPTPVIALLPGPDAEPAILDAITAASFTIAPSSDRIGTRLEGPALPSHSVQNARDRRSRPMVRGAIELTPSGLVVLGPDHPTTGGYPVIAVLPEAAFGRFMSLPIGARARLVLSAQKPT